MREGNKKLPAIPMRFETWWREVRFRAFMPLVAVLAIAAICRLWPHSFSNSLIPAESTGDYQSARQSFPVKPPKKKGLKHQSGRPPLPTPTLPIASLPGTDSVVEVTP